MKLNKKLQQESDKQDYNQYFSTILYCLYKLGDNERYSTLSELPFILDGKNLLNFLEFYGGKTITIPTKEELLNVISALQIYQDVDLQGKEYPASIPEKVFWIYKDLQKINNNELIG